MGEHVTFWRMRALPGKAKELQAMMEESSGELSRLAAAGWMATVVGRRKEDEDEIWGSVVWDTSERYFANGDTPEQQAWYGQMRALLAEDPEWFDCDLVAEEKAAG